MHQRVEIALNILIQRERAAPGECRADQEFERERDIEQFAAAQIEPDQRGQEHHRHDPRLGERQVVGCAHPDPRDTGFDLVSA